jgi:hypothetical protein
MTKPDNMPNKLTGANAGGPHPLSKRSRRAARVAQFCRWTATKHLTSFSKITMPNPFQSLFAAILDDDRAKVKELLDNDPVLTKRGVAEEGRYESRIAHWIYSGDTVLHVAAAGYRVEIARMLLAAGADSASARNRRSSQPLHYAADGCLDNPSWNPRRQVAMIRLQT